MTAVESGSVCIRTFNSTYSGVWEIELLIFSITANSYFNLETVFHLIMINIEFGEHRFYCLGEARNVN